MALRKIKHPETGEVIEVSDDMFNEVYTHQGYTDVDSPQDLTRAELNEKASGLGIENPETFNTKADVLAEIAKRESGG